MLSKQHMHHLRPADLRFYSIPDLWCSSYNSLFLSISTVHMFVVYSNIKINKISCCIELRLVYSHIKTILHSVILLHWISAQLWFSAGKAMLIFCTTALLIKFTRYPISHVQNQEPPSAFNYKKVKKRFKCSCLLFSTQACFTSSRSD